MFFFGPVAWQLWMALRLRFVSLEEARRCLFSPYAAGIAGILFVVNIVNLAWGMERIGAGKGRAISRRMAVHCISILLFAIIGTATSMSMLSGAYGGRVFPPLKMIVGALNGASMCFIFYAGATMAVAARLVPPERRHNTTERRVLALTRSFNTWLFVLGVPLFVATSLAAAALGDSASMSASIYRLLVSMAMPVTMGSIVFIRAYKGIAVLQGVVGKEIPQ
jgi:hypothetical protein